MNKLKKALFIGGLAGTVVTDGLFIFGTHKADKFLRETKTILKPGENPDEVVLYKHMNDSGYLESQTIVVCHTHSEYYSELFKGISKYYIPAGLSGITSVTSLIASQIGGKD